MDRDKNISAKLGYEFDASANANERIVLRSSIRPELMRKTLLRGTILGGLGGLCLLIGGIFLPLQQMKDWGFLLFVFSLIIIAIGLLPYKRLKRLEEKPYTLTINDLKTLQFLQGKQLLTVSFSSIDHINYFDLKNVYGICIFLKNPLPQQRMKMKNSFSSQKCDLFFPYFSQRSFNTLKDCLSESDS